MWQTTDNDTSNQPLYLAGEKVRPGKYRQVGNGRTLTLETEDVLPASLDGRVACYVPIESTWGEINRLPKLQ